MAKVSIIMPCYNAALTITQAIESVFKQQEHDWELWVVDDASSDNSVAIVSQYAEQDPRIQLITLAQNSGPAVARNVATENATGRYIAFLDSDDWWPDNKLSRQLTFMQQTHVALSYGGFAKTTNEGQVKGRFVPPLTTHYRDLLKRCGFNLCTVMYDVDQLGKRMMEPNSISEDYTIWLDILKAGTVAKGLPETLSYYRTSVNSVSANKASAAKTRWQILRQREQLPWPDSLYCFICYTIDGIRKYCLRWHR